jgi:hypothetical protein
MNHSKRLSSRNGRPRLKQLSPAEKDSFDHDGFANTSADHSSRAPATLCPSADCQRRPPPISAQRGIRHFNGKDCQQSGESARYSAPVEAPFFKPGRLCSPAATPEVPNACVLQPPNDCSPLSYWVNRIRIFVFCQHSLPRCSDTTRTHAASGGSQG